MSKLSILLISGICALEVSAQDANPLMSPQEIEIKNIVKKRQFPGGVDEQPLKVQSQLPIVTRKLGPTQEIEAPEEQHAEQD